MIAVLWFRWMFGFTAYFLGPPLGVFKELVWAETTGATLISFVVIGTAVLRSELFSIRGAFAEALLVGVHQRWLEHELRQAVVDQAETAVGEDCGVDSARDHSQLVLDGPNAVGDV